MKPLQPLRYDRLNAFVYFPGDSRDIPNNVGTLSVGGDAGITKIMTETGLDNIPDLLLNGYMCSIFTVNTLRGKGEEFLFETNRCGDNEFPLVARLLDSVFHKHHTDYKGSELHVTYSAAAVIADVLYDLTTRTSKDEAAPSATPFGDMVGELLKGTDQATVPAAAKKRRNTSGVVDMPCLVDDRVFRPVSDTAELLEAIRLTRIAFSRWATIAKDVQHLVVEIRTERVVKATGIRHCGMLGVLLLGSVGIDKLHQELQLAGSELLPVEWEKTVTATNILSSETLGKVKACAAAKYTGFSDAAKLLDTITRLGKVPAKEGQTRTNILRQFSLTSTFALLASRHLQPHVIQYVAVAAHISTHTALLLPSIIPQREVPTTPRPFIIPGGPDMVDFALAAMREGDPAKQPPSNSLSLSLTHQHSSISPPATPSALDPSTLRRTLLEPMTSTGVDTTLINSVLANLMAEDDSRRTIQRICDSCNYLGEDGRAFDRAIDTRRIMVPVYVSWARLVSLYSYLTCLTLESARRHHLAHSISTPINVDPTSQWSGGDNTKDCRDAVSQLTDNPKSLLDPHLATIGLPPLDAARVLLDSIRHVFLGEQPTPESSNLPLPDIQRGVITQTLALYAARLAAAGATQGNELTEGLYQPDSGKGERYVTAFLKSHIINNEVDIIRLLASNDAPGCFPDCLVGSSARPFLTANGSVPPFNTTSSNSNSNTNTNASNSHPLTLSHINHVADGILEHIQRRQTLEMDINNIAYLVGEELSLRNHLDRHYRQPIRENTNLLRTLRSEKWAGSATLNTSISNNRRGPLKILDETQDIEEELKKTLELLDEQTHNCIEVCVTKHLAFLEHDKEQSQARLRAYAKHRTAVIEESNKTRREALNTAKEDGERRSNRVVKAVKAEGRKRLKETQAEVGSIVDSLRSTTTRIQRENEELEREILKLETASDIGFEEGRKEGIINSIRREKEFKLCSENQRAANEQAQDIYTRQLGLLINSLDELRFRNGQFKELVLSKINQEDAAISRAVDTSAASMGERLERTLGSSL